MEMLFGASCRRLALHGGGMNEVFRLMENLYYPSEY
jgi:hypothetical protein